MRELFLSKGGSTESASGNILNHLLGRDGTISYSEVEAVICSACTVSFSQRQALSEAFRAAIMEEQSRYPSSASSLTRQASRSSMDSSNENFMTALREPPLRANFPSFLLVMRRVVDMNLLSSGNSAAGVVGFEHDTSATA